MADDTTCGFSSSIRLLVQLLFVYGYGFFFTWSSWCSLSFLFLDQDFSFLFLYDSHDKEAKRNDINPPNARNVSARGMLARKAMPNSGGGMSCVRGAVRAGGPRRFDRFAKGEVRTRACTYAYASGECSLPH